MEIEDYESSANAMNDDTNKTESLGETTRDS